MNELLIIERTVLGTIEDSEIVVVKHNGITRVEYTAGMAICCDGSGGNPQNDPCFQPELAYYNSGKFLNPYEVPYNVVPPLIRYADIGVVMGAQCLIVNLTNGMATPAIVGDQGPEEKIGEASVEAAKRCGLSGDPNSGGCDESCILYLIWPGIAAKVDGIEYKLQSS